jgi:hypothetical protein
MPMRDAAFEEALALGLDQAIHLLEEVARDDLEACAAAIKAEDKGEGLRSLERAFAKLDTAIDLLRNQGAFGRER